MPFQLKKGTAVPRSMGTFTDASGQEHHDTEGVPYREGEIVWEDEVTPPLLERIQDENDAWTNAIYESVSEEEANEYLAAHGRAPRAIPEHSNEATVLAEAGRDVLTSEEKHDVYAEDPEDTEERVQGVFDADPDVRDALDLDPTDEGKVRGEALASGADVGDLKRAPAQRDVESPQPRRRGKKAGQPVASSPSGSTESQE